jgi:hypothetical protein
MGVFGASYLHIQHTDASYWLLLLMAYVVPATYYALATTTGRRRLFYGLGVLVHCYVQVRATNTEALLMARMSAVLLIHSLST